MNKLSVIIPAYNEEETIGPLLDRVIMAELPQEIKIEIIIVDDGSTDSTKTLVSNFIENNPNTDIRLISHKVNQGKGASIQTALEQVTGDYVIIQDADLEYDPDDYQKMIGPVNRGNADVVFSSRFIGGNPHRILFFWHSVGNKFLTLLINLSCNLNLTDMESGYKLIRTSLIQSLNLKEKKFGFEPELTAKVSKKSNVKIYEVGVSYFGRTYTEGKKINWKDGLFAIYCIVKYGIFNLK